MTGISFLTVIFVSILSCQLVFSGDSMCKICECSGDDQHQVLSLLCPNRNLKNMPAPETSILNITTLDLKKNRITHLNDLDYNRLEILDVSFNEISFIQPGVFTTVRHLKYLDLTFNSLKEIKVPETFHGLENLLILNMSHNDLHSLEANMFSVFIELEELDLGNNPISDLNLLRNLRNLKALRLCNMGFKAPSLNVLEKLNKLEFLDLTGNNLQRVPYEGLSQLCSLRHLVLSMNDIPTLNEKSFPNMTSLEILEISEMRKLSSVGQYTFSLLSNLRTLEMQYNDNLIHIHQNAFGMKSPERLKEVLLKSNQISRLRGDAFHNLDTLDLQGNPWKCDCEMMWMLNCSAITLQVSGDLKCSSPRRLLNRDILDLNFLELRCTDDDEEKDRHLSRIYRTVALAVAVISFFLIGVIIIIFLKGRYFQKFFNLRKQADGSVYYVKVHSSRQSIN